MPNGQQFDVEGARKEGYSDADIAGYLASSRKFDIAGARKEGYSDAEIITHLTQPPSYQPKYSEAESVASRPAVKAPGLPEQPSFVKQITTGQMPLESMQPGLPSPFQHPENRRTAEVLTAPFALGEEVAAEGAIKVGMRLLTGMAGGVAGQEGAKILGGGPRTQAIAGVLGGLATGQLGNKLGGIVEAAALSPQEWAKVLTSKNRYMALTSAVLKKLPGIDAAVAQREAELAVAKLEAEETAHYRRLVKAGEKLYKESKAAEAAEATAKSGRVAQANKEIRREKETAEIARKANEPVFPPQPEATSITHPSIRTKEPFGPEKPPRRARKAASTGGTGTAPPPKSGATFKRGGKIVTPGSTPPQQPVTYQSVEYDDLVKMATSGRYPHNVNAAKEMKRRGLPIPPNVKFLLEQPTEVEHRAYKPGGAPGQMP
jgi:hypothetical protein